MSKRCARILTKVLATFIASVSLSASAFAIGHDRWALTIGTVFFVDFIDISFNP